MAEPIRKPIRPLHRPPLHRSRPRNTPPAASRAALRIAEAVPVPPPAAPPLPPARLGAAEPGELEPVERPWTGIVAPAREKRLRLGLQIAILLHIAAVLPLLVAAAAAPTLPDAVLATAVLLAGAGVLTLGSASRKR